MKDQLWSLSKERERNGAHRIKGILYIVLYEISKTLKVYKHKFSRLIGRIVNEPKRYAPYGSSACSYICNLISGPKLLN
jgi:hypothetical protein